MRPYVRNPKLWASQRPSSAGPLDRTDDEDPNLPPRPLPNSYWASPTLLASEYPGGLTETLAISKLTALLDVGITDFFDLTEEGELVPYSPILERLVSDRGGRIMKLDATKESHSNFFQNQPRDGQGDDRSVRYARFPIRDGSIPSAGQLQAVLDALSIVHRQRDRKSVVHCWGGIGRTGTIVGCWLVHSGVVRDEEEVVLVQGETISAVMPGSDGTPLVAALSSDTSATGGEQAQGALIPRVCPAGEVALKVLERKWKGVDKSWRVFRTPENALQADMVRLYRPAYLPM